MTHRFRVGQMVEVVWTAPQYTRFVGERFVLEKTCPLFRDAPTWWTPFRTDLGEPIFAQERCLKPIDDPDAEAFKQFMTDIVKPRELEPA